MYESDGPCPTCLQPTDNFGDHTLCCGHGGERITHHNTLLDHLHQLAVSAALNSSKESRFLFPGQNTRPADVFIPNPRQDATVAGAVTTPGFALD